MYLRCSLQSKWRLQIFPGNAIISFCIYMFEETFLPDINSKLHDILSRSKLILCLFIYSKILEIVLIVLWSISKYGWDSWVLYRICNSRGLVATLAKGQIIYRELTCKLFCAWIISKMQWCNINDTIFKSFFYLIHIGW